MRGRLPQSLAFCAGLLGAAGVAVSAAGAHGPGASPLASVAGTFLLIHAAAILGLAALIAASSGGRAVALGVAGTIMIAGVVLFSGDLVLAGLAGLRPFPPAAPIGGSLLIAGWLAIPVGLLIDGLRHRR